MTNNLLVPVYVNRDEIVQPTETVQLRAVFKDPAGNLVDSDTFPTITIISPTGNVLLGSTSAGVSKVSTGTYNYDYTVGISPTLGVYHDVWMATIDGFSVEAQFQFVVHQSDLPSLDVDGYVYLGSDPGFNYSQTAICNLNKLIKLLKARLNSSGKVQRKDANGNMIFVDCDIFTIDSLVAFLAAALGEFNQTPFFTHYTFDDTAFVDMFYAILVEGALMWALTSQALIERGREYSITDSGINFTPPTVSDIMMTQFSTHFSSYQERLKFIKNSMRPAPIGLGLFTVSGNVNPAIARLRHLRSRRFF